MKTEKPNTLADAVNALKNLLPPEQLDVVRRSTEEDLIRFHFNLGAYIRNLWVYRHGSPLTARIRARGGRIAEGDALSNLIIEALWHDLNGRTLNLHDSVNFRALAPGDNPEAVLTAIT
jgi:hypothetical protein